MNPSCLDRHNRCRCTNTNGGVKTAAWRTFGRRWTLHRAVKNERVTAQGPGKKPPMDCMFHRGGGGQRLNNHLCTSNWRQISGLFNEFHFPPEANLSDVGGGWVWGGQPGPPTPPTPPHTAAQGAVGYGEQRGRQRVDGCGPAGGVVHGANRWDLWAHATKKQGRELPRESEGGRARGGGRPRGAPASGGGSRGRGRVQGIGRGEVAIGQWAPAAQTATPLGVMPTPRLGAQSNGLQGGRHHSLTIGFALDHPGHKGGVGRLLQA